MLKKQPRVLDLCKSKTLEGSARQWGHDPIYTAIAALMCGCGS
jgi:hypothetical protein